VREFRDASLTAGQHISRKATHALSRLSLAVLLIGISAFACHAVALRAGVAKVDFTTPPGLPMYGFLDRLKDNKLSTGALDPLGARVLVLEADEKRLALVTLDLGRPFRESELAQLRQRLKTSAGISFLIVTASHTHSGPNILDQDPGGPLRTWEDSAIEKILAAVEDASHHLVEARIGTGRGEVYIGYNRRLVQPDGSVKMLWTNPHKQPTAPLDPTVLVMRIDDAEGKPLAVLVNYACHPVVFGSDNLNYSTDFVGVMRDTVERAFDQKPLCLFLQGADGDINPYYATTPLSDDAAGKRDWTGRQLADEAVRVAKQVHTDAAPDATIDFADDVMNFELRWPAKAFREGLLKTYGPHVFEDHADRLADDPPPDRLELHVTTVLLNKHIALIGMPGEPFVDFQINWRDRCPVQDAFFLGYANGYFDYLPTIDAAAQGGYGAGDSNTYVEVGAGERMLRQALVRVYEMLGKLKDAPERD
jgi:neutral/alkaline ceramidase-like enzyme